ncbi:MAG: periplasmic heavy metal sensor [Bryobacterales bacterium]|nr:periplasmic heavy metal sensor [Bryobacterales bacterium]
MKRLMVGMMVAAMALFAQGPGGFRHGPGLDAAGGNLDSVKATLGLSDAQVDQLKQIRKDAFTSNESLRTQMREKQQALRTAMRSENPDGAAIAAALRDLQSLRTQLKAKQEELVKTSRAVLTPQQATQLANLEQALKAVPAARQAMALGLISPPAERAGAPMMRGAGRGARPGPMGARTHRSAPPVL